MESDYRERTAIEKLVNIVLWLITATLGVVLVLYLLGVI